MGVNDDWNEDRSNRLLDLILDSIAAVESDGAVFADRSTRPSRGRRKA
jgi:hypothetical protein